MSDKLLEIRNLTRVFMVGGFAFGKKLTAVDDVSLTVTNERPVILSLVGESGCGKTTLTKMILRLLEPTRGDILLNGHSLLSRRELPEKEFCEIVQPIFQNPFEAFSMRRRVENYLLDTALKFGGAKSRRQAEEMADQALQSVGLSYAVVTGKYATQFSGGELQRVSIARALITHPRLIIADEPVAMIDASMKMNIVNLFKEIRDRMGISFIYITHDLSTAYYVSDYIATLYRGSLVEYGRALDIMENPAHPYTELLMNSVPHVGDKWERGVLVSESEGREFGLTTCKFASRCSYATEECRKARPPMHELEGGRRVLCCHPLVK